jgi:hypothetical protein
MTLRTGHYAFITVMFLSFFGLLSLVSCQSVPDGEYAGLAPLPNLNPYDEDDKWYHENKLVIRYLLSDRLFISRTVGKYIPFRMEDSTTIEERLKGMGTDTEFCWR